MSAGRGVLLVAPELLEEALHMPSDARIVSAGFDGVHVTLVVESPDLPEVDPVPMVTAAVTHHRERYEWKWGVG